jgi:hypothetical protein
MKPFNPNPGAPQQQWVRWRNGMLFHLRDASVRLPNVAVLCGERPIPNDCEFSLSPYQRCPGCDAKARDTERAA